MAFPHQPLASPTRATRPAVAEPSERLPLTQVSFSGDSVQRRGCVPVSLVVQLLVLRRQRLPEAPVRRDALLPGLPRHDSGLRKFYGSP